MTETVVLAGATGRLGGQIARGLLDQPEARLLVRGGDANKRTALDPRSRAGPRSSRATAPREGSK